MKLRSVKERIIQTLTFEAVGITLVAPSYAYFAGSSIGKGFALIALLSMVILVWAPIYNTLFDFIEHACTGRPASDRPHNLRILHATLHEVSAVSMTCPILIWVGGHTLWGALSFNLGLTLTYTAYTYVFHIVYDRLRPVRGCGLVQQTQYARSQGAT